MQRLTDFLWAAGIENTFIVAPHRTSGKRLDEYELTDHYARWNSDLESVASLGINALRWGVPWYRVEPAPGQYDWAWVDSVIETLTDKLHIEPIVDLIHYGTPEWMNEAALSPEFLSAFERYTEAFCSRYSGRVHYATPVNEPYTAAEFCGRRGDWPPYLHGERGFAAVMIEMCKAAVVASRVLKRHGITTVHVEVATGCLATDPKVEDAANLFTLRNELYWDLLTRRVTEKHPMFRWLLGNGISAADLEWFHANAGADLIDILGVNYYPQWSYVAMLSGGGLLPLNGGTTLFEMHLRRFWEKYQLPMMITETSVRGGEWEKRDWLTGSIRSIRALRGEGVRIDGYTWFPVIDMVDWEYRNREGAPSEYAMRLGLWTSDRFERPSAGTYRAIIGGGIDG